MQAILTRFVRDDSGATALDYGLIAKTLGGKLTNSFVNVGNKL